MNVTVNWQGESKFEAALPQGSSILYDANGEGPTPMETLLSTLAVCAAMDVVSILEKMRQKVTSYRIEATGTRPPQGEFPRGFLTMTLTHVLTGEDLVSGMVEKAVRLSDEKYCSVAATLRGPVTLESTFEIRAS